MALTVAIEFADVAAPTLWYPLTCQVLGAGWQRGATEDRGPLTAPEPGLAVLYLIDQNRDLDPANTIGAWYGLWDIGSLFRISLQGVSAFYGRVDAITHTMDPPNEGASIPGWATSARMITATPTTTGSASVGTNGVRFTANATGRITALRYWHNACAGFAHSISLWNAAGTKIAGPLLDTPTASGWRELPLPASVAVTAGQVFTVSATDPGGRGYTAGSLTSLTADLTISGNYTNAGSDLYPTTAAGVALHVDVVYQRRTSIVGAGVPVARVSVVDWVTKMAAVTTAAGTPWPSERTDQRADRLMVAGGVPSPRLNDTSSGVVQAGGIVNDTWADLIAMVQNEQGSFEARGGGAYYGYFHSKSETWTKWTPSSPTSSAQLHLGCDTAHTPSYPLTALELDTVSGTVRNSIIAGRVGGSPRPAVEDAASITKYGKRVHTQTDLLLTTDAAVDTWAAFLLAQSKTPARELRSASMDARDGATATKVESIMLFQDRVHIYQDNFGQTIDRLARPIGIAWEIDNEANGVVTWVLGQHNV